MASEGLSVQLACRVLDVSESGYYAWRKRPLSARAVRHVWLTDRIRAVHAASRGTYGARRVHAELVLGQGISVGHEAVEQLMRVAGLEGLSGRPRYRKSAPHAAATDRVGRQFARAGPDHRWVTEIVCSQMTKANRLAGRAGRDHVADLDGVVGDDDAVDEQLDQLPSLLEGRGSEAVPDLTAECFY